MLMRLSESWEGEQGRRAGERYERWVVKRAPILIRGGMGGETDQPEVRRRLTQWLTRLDSDRLLKDEEADPTLADIIWWKGDQVLVVEVSLKVDAEGMHRVQRRAATLQQAGIRAIPVVIGERWLHSDVRDLALSEGVEWYVRGNMSPGFEAFRKLPFDAEQDTSLSGG